MWRSARLARAYVESAFQSYSMLSAAICARAFPKSFETTYSEPSIPEESPAVVMILPLST